MKFVVPSDTLPAAVALRLVALMCSTLVKPGVWKLEVMMKRASGPLPVQDSATVTLNPEPDTKSKTGIVAFRLPDVRLVFTWNAEPVNEVSPKATKTGMPVLRSHCEISTKASAELAVFPLSVLSACTNTSVRTVPEVLSKKASAACPRKCSLKI